MLGVDEAIADLLGRAACRVSVEQADLDSALGRTLAEDIVATIDVPPADNSAMDGYALRHADWQAADQPIPLSQRITAGSVPTPLAAATAARIFTGATLPPGADTVVMQEHCDGTDSDVRIRRLPDRGANIRRQGQDIASGQRVLSAGQRLRPQDLGLVASLGAAELAVYRRLRVAVLSTGDELVEPGVAAGPGQIYNSNRFTLLGQLGAWGYEIVDLGIVRDDPGQLRQTLRDAADRSDVIISSGGVSVGEEDHVKAVVGELGSLDLWRIAIKPGKPFAFGEVCGTPFIGLPGNPVSVFVTLLVIARPFLFACQGTDGRTPRACPLPACFSKPGSQREDYLRACSTPQGVELFPNQSSGVLYSACWGDGLVRQRAGQAIEPGDPVDFLPYALFD